MKIGRGKNEDVEFVDLPAEDAEPEPDINNIELTDEDEGAEAEPEPEDSDDEVTPDEAYADGSAGPDPVLEDDSAADADGVSDDVPAEPRERKMNKKLARLAKSRDAQPVTSK